MRTLWPILNLKCVLFAFVLSAQFFKNLCIFFHAFSISSSWDNSCVHGISKNSFHGHSGFFPNNISEGVNRVVSWYVSFIIYVILFTYLAQAECFLSANFLKNIPRSLCILLTIFDWGCLIDENINPTPFCVNFSSHFGDIYCVPLSQKIFSTFPYVQRFFYRAFCCPPTYGIYMDVFWKKHTLL